MRTTSPAYTITWHCPAPHDGRPADVITIKADGPLVLAEAVNLHACRHIGIYERLQLKAGRVPGRLAVRTEKES